MILLQRLEVSVDDLLGVKVEHSICNLSGPVDDLGRQDLHL